MNEQADSTNISIYYEQNRSGNGISELVQKHPPDPEDKARLVGCKATELLCRTDRVSIWRVFSRVESEQSGDDIHPDPRLEVKHNGNDFILDSWDGIEDPQRLVSTIEDHIAQKGLVIVLENGYIQRDPGAYSPPEPELANELVFT